MPRYLSVDDAVPVLAGAARVLVIGCSGGGKSTMSQCLAVGLDLPYVSMDRDFFWLPGWVGRDRAQQRVMIAAKVAEPRWIMDGSNPSSFDIRVPRADIVLWVRLPRWLCLWGIVKRGIRYFGRTRPDMAPGCTEKFPDPEFIRYVWKFEQKHAPLFARNFDLYGPDVPVLQLKSHRQIGKLLDILGIPA